MRLGCEVDLGMHINHQSVIKMIYAQLGLLWTSIAELELVLGKPEQENLDRAELLLSRQKTKLSITAFPIARS